MIDRCRWVKDKDVPMGKFLVPGCWNRAIRGDDADCHCLPDDETEADQLQEALSRIADLEKRLTCIEVKK